MKQQRKLIIEPELMEDDDLVEAREQIYKLYNDKIDTLLLRCTPKTEYEPYGDTYVVAGNYYDDVDIEKCKKEAKLDIKAEFLVNPIKFIKDYIGCEEFFKPHLVLEIINNLK